MTITPFLFVLGIGIFFLWKGIVPYCLLLFVILTSFNIFVTWKYQIRLTDEKFFALIGFNQQVKIDWQDMIMVQYVKQGRKLNYLEIGTQEGVVQVDLRTFDAPSVWREFQKFAPSKALEKDAYAEMPAYQDWVKEKERLVKDIGKSYKIGYSFPIKMMMFLIWFILITIGATILMGLAIKSNIVWAFYGILVIGAGLAFVESLITRVEMTAEKIKTVGLWGPKEITWAQVTTIEEGRRHLTFWGEDKRLVFRSHLWHGKDEEEMVKMLYAQIEYHKVKLARQKAG